MQICNHRRQSSKSSWSHTGCHCTLDKFDLHAHARYFSERQNPRHFGQKNVAIKKIAFGATQVNANRQYFQPDSRSEWNKWKQYDIRDLNRTPEKLARATCNL